MSARDVFVPTNDLITCDRIVYSTMLSQHEQVSWCFCFCFCFTRTQSQNATTERVPAKMTQLRSFGFSEGHRVNTLAIHSTRY